VKSYQLSEAEARRRLALCTPGVAEEMFDFGKRLLDYRIEVSHRLDAKAAAMAGYGVAVLTLLVATHASWKGLTGAPRGCVLLAALVAFGAVILALTAQALRDFVWFTQREWLNEECIRTPSMLLGYRVLTLQGVLTSYEEVCTKKARWLRCAQYALGLVAALLLAALLQVTGLHSVGGHFLVLPRW
jgi:magnesium-transporting ATPase (P-type)